jgi:Kae1-associated kinase Bud32
MDKIGEGAEAIVYTDKIKGTKCVVKIRERKKYRISELDLKIRVDRTKKETMIMNKAAIAGIYSPKIIAAGKFVIVMEYLKGSRLDGFNIDLKTMRNIGSMLARIHDAGIVHGDFTPANIILCGNNPAIIDFGLAEISHSVEEMALDILLMKRSVSKTAYSAFVKGYLKNSNKDDVFKRLSEIERRGRYQLRTLTN